MLLLVAPVEGVLGLASEHVHLGAKYQTLPMGSFLGEKSSFIKKGKIPKRETLGPFDWDLMGFIGVPLFNEK